MFDLSRTALSLRSPRCGRRPIIARKPAWDCLDKRELLSTLILPASNGSTFTGSTPNLYGPGVDSGQTFQGGDYLGMLDGTTALSTYSVDDSDPAITPAEYNATVTTNGTTFGKAVPNAGAVAWLLTNIGPTVTNADQQGALQAAIWRAEYGTNLSAGGFQLDGADNTNDPGNNDSALIADYKSDVAALGSHTAPVSSVDWISPSDSEGNDYQSLVAMPVGHVETLTLPDTNVPEFSYQYFDPSSGETIPTSGSAGNFLGTLGSTKLAATYCVSIDLGISAGASYGTTVANTPAVFNELVPHAGAIAWLLTNLGPKALTADQQNALQAAIWQEEYGAADFQLTPGNDPTLVADYEADLAAVGTHTAPVTDVLWLSPYDTNDSNPDQGLVALPASSPVRYSTHTALVSSVTPAAYGRTVPFTATVTDTSSASGPKPTGSVQFEIKGADFGNPVALGAQGTASITESNLGVGTYTIDAVYIPTGSFATSPPATCKETITPDATEVSVKASANPTTNTQAVSFSVTVHSESPGSGATPLGTVVFQIDGQTRAAVPLSGGRAVLKNIKLPVGTHTVTVYYSPANADYAAQAGELIGGETVKK